MRAREYEIGTRLPQVSVLGNACSSAGSDVGNIISDFKISKAQ